MRWLWRRLADWCVPASALRIVRIEPITVAEVDAILRREYMPGLRQGLAQTHLFQRMNWPRDP